MTLPPAEAQVDFGITEVVEEGEVKDIHCLVMSFPYSNGGLVVSLPSEDQECFLEGLKMLIDQAKEASLQPTDKSFVKGG